MVSSQATSLMKKTASADQPAAPSWHGPRPGPGSLNNPGYLYSEREKVIKMLNPFSIEIPLEKVIAPILPLPW